MESHSDNEKGVGGTHGQSCDARREKELMVPRGKHSTTAAAEQAESPEQPMTIDEEH